MLAVIDCRISNLRSVINALDAVGTTARVVVSPEELDEADGVILPGVGAFGDGMRNLTEQDFTHGLPRLVEDGRPLLGICLGMQLLATRSFEFGEHTGLGLIDGSVEPIVSVPSLRVPHVGWNTVEVVTESPLLVGLSLEPAFYFIHSFQFVPKDQSVVTATAEYGQPLTACVQRDNVFGVQFHPEKSQHDGLKLLENFVRLCDGC